MQDFQLFYLKSFAKSFKHLRFAFLSVFIRTQLPANFPVEIAVP